MSLFELSSRLPATAHANCESNAEPRNAAQFAPHADAHITKRPSTTGVCAVARYSAEHMLEVLENILRLPHHGLASEGNLLRWQLRTNLQFGHALPSPSPPLACTAPTKQELLVQPRIVVVMPFVAAERERLSKNLRGWRVGGNAVPCATPGITQMNSNAGKAPEAHLVDLMLYSADRAGSEESAWLNSPKALLHGSDHCFRNVLVRFANLSSDEQYYIGGWDNTGPNNLFYSLFFDKQLHAKYDAMFWMEVRAAS